VLFLQGLSNRDSVRDLVSLFCLFSSLTLGSVHGISHCCVPWVDRDILQVTAIGLKAHVQRDGVAIGVLPIRDTGRDPVLGHVCGSEFPRWRPQDDWRLSIGHPGNLLVLVAGWVKRVLNNVGNLNDSLNAGLRVHSWRVAYKLVLLDFL
jgi:hypothetical protein